jgi:cell division protein FtsZ
MQFEMLKEKSSIIKVIGVGGGGGNAVNHMYRQGITGVDFIVCNTDAQALELSPIPNKVQLGASLTEGMGAGSIPEVGKNSAIENIDDIKQMLGSNTKMLFITAGMGGGTGTGASPIIAKAARELDILTVGIITTPFAFEGKRRKIQAEEGMAELTKYVDSFLVISNDKLRQIFGNLTLGSAFAQADNILTTAAKGIAEIITLPGYVNVDFKDVRTVMKDSGVSIMGSCSAGGENRAFKAVEGALASPLLKDNEIEGARYILLNISSSTEHEVTMDEVTTITDYIQEEAGLAADVIWGNCIDDKLGDCLSVTIIATGFQTKDEREKKEGERKIITILDPTVPHTNKPINEFINPVKAEPVAATAATPYMKNREEAKPKADQKQSGLFDLFQTKPEEPKTIKYNLAEEEPPAKEEVLNAGPELTFKVIEPVKESEPVAKMPEPVKEQKKPEPEPPVVVGADDHKTDESIEEQLRKSRERIMRLKDLSMKLRSGNLQEMENVPAYKRKEIALQQTPASDESQVSRFSLLDEDGKTEIRSNNSFLHDNVD